MKVKRPDFKLQLCLDEDSIVYFPSLRDVENCILDIQRMIELSLSSIPTIKVSFKILFYIHSPDIFRPYIHIPYSLIIAFEAIQTYIAQIPEILIPPPPFNAIGWGFHPLLTPPPPPSPLGSVT